MTPISLPTVFEDQHEGANSASFVIEPFHPGYGTTVGNALRRVLLSSLEGVAISAVKIKGVQHEFSTLPGIKEDFVDILLNLKKVIVRADDYVLDEGMKLTLAIRGERVVTAGDFECSTGVQVLNRDFPLMTLTSQNSSIELEAFLSRGRGFVPIESRSDEKRELGLIAVDSYFSPIEKVGFIVEDVRVGQMTNFDRIKITIKTNGVLTPLEAIQGALKLLIDQFQHVLSMSEGTPDTISEIGNSATDLGVLQDVSMKSVDEGEAALGSTGGEEDRPKSKRGRKKKEE